MGQQTRTIQQNLLLPPPPRLKLLSTQSFSILRHFCREKNLHYLPVIYCHFSKKEIHQKEGEKQQQTTTTTTTATIVSIDYDS